MVVGFLATIWIFLSNNIFGVPYGAWLKAKDNENELSELHQITLFLASLFTKKYHITTHWFLCYFLLSFSLFGYLLGFFMEMNFYNYLFLFFCQS